MVTCFASRNGLASALSVVYVAEVLFVAYLTVNNLLPECKISDETLKVYTVAFVVFFLSLGSVLSLWAEKQKELHVSQLNELYEASKRASDAKSVFVATMRCVTVCMDVRVCTDSDQPVRMCGFLPKAL